MDSTNLQLHSCIISGKKIQFEKWCEKIKEETQDETHMEEKSQLAVAVPLLKKGKKKKRKNKKMYQQVVPVTR
jgi:uncharacterized phage-like protein YoqJ